MVFTLIFQGGISLLAKIKGGPLGLSFLGESSYSYFTDLSRMRGTLGFPNQFGAYLILMLPILLSLMIFIKQSFYKYLIITSVALGLTGLFLTLSRSSWAGFILSMLIFGLALIRKGLMKPKYFIAMLTLAMVVVAVYFLKQDTIAARMETGADGRWRNLMIDIAIPMIKSNPVIGVGLFNYQYHSFKIFAFWHPVHNTFLRLAAETGIPGALMFIIILLQVLRTSYRTYLQKDVFFSAVSIGIFCGYIAFVVAINFGPQFQHYRIKQLFWLNAGLAFAMPNIKKRERLRKFKFNQMNMADSKEKRCSASANKSGNFFSISDKLHS